MCFVVVAVTFFGPDVFPGLFTTLFTILKLGHYSLLTSKDISSSFYHFIILNSDLKTVIWDSLGNSKTVSNGHLESFKGI
ncbi:DUF261 family protein [Borreliella garinii]|uniref:DUF261 family protein n=1 Tax=Borreliella garinii TaxID=29519 RepID=UPI00292FDB73|nr:DUF261 family protein [Borreliella garinii]